MWDFVSRNVLEAGQEILFGHHQGARRHGKNCADAKFRKGTIKSYDGMRTVILSDGEEIELNYEPGTSKHRSKEHGRVVWSVPLPQGSDDAVRSFCQVALDGPNMTLFHVSEVEDGIVRARIVLDGPFVESEDDLPAPPGYVPLVEFEAIDDDEPMHISTSTFELDVTARGKNIVLRSQEYVPSSGEIEEGTLIAARDLSAVMDETGKLTFRAIDWERIDEFGDFRDIARFLPPREPDLAPSTIRFSGKDQSRFGSAAHVENEAELAKASLDPDEALAFVYEDGTVNLVGHIGRLYQVWDSAADSLYGAAPGPGLWSVKNSKGWSHQDYEGGWDAGIDADWIPATVEELEFWGYDLESMDREIADMLENDEPVEGGTLRQIELAKAADTPSLTV